MKRRSHERLIRAAIIALMTLAPLSSACDGDSAGDPADPRLHGGATSLPALGAGVWAALRTGDEAALDSLRLTEHEHNTHVWPEQPAAAEPSANANLDLWWQNIQLRNRAAVNDLLRTAARSRLHVRETVCTGERRRYLTYLAHTDCYLVLDGPGGQRRLQAFRHVVEMDGRYKVVRYYGSE